MTVRKKIFDIIQIGDKSNLLSRAFDIFLVVVIFSNVGAMFLETFSKLAAYNSILRDIEFVTTMIFCGEYVLRIITADFLYPKYGPVKSRLRFLVSYDGVVDLLTILPAFFLTGFIVFRLLRVVRIFHLFRLNAQYDSFNVITNVLYEKRNQLASSIFIILILMLGSSLCMYSAEHAAQPDVFDNAFSGIWWSVSTVLTVGYGDIYPVTILGKAMAIVIAFLGVGVVAIPTGIISAGFVEQYSKDQNITDYKKEDIHNIFEIPVSGDLVGSSIWEIRKQNSLDIYLILRDELHIFPSETLKLKEGDIIIAKNLK